MPRNDPPEVKMQKTLQVLGMVNLMLSPLLLIDSRLALAVGLVVNGLLISQLHDIGKKEGRDPICSIREEHISQECFLPKTHPTKILAKWIIP
ncbi:hypothetical protein [Legionella anisa]|uniref:hypothetical protein n=1 Tax=Legionella anisa TaxID=28082 RepID=UPI0003493110|nr:hypothetical protein [Legionella anisa]